MTPHAHFHQCTPPVALVHHRKAGIPPFCELVNLSYLILLVEKFDRVINSVPPPPQASIAGSIRNPIATLMMESTEQSTLCGTNERDLAKRMASLYVHLFGIVEEAGA